MSARVNRTRHQIPLRVLLVDDDEGEFLLVRDLLAKYPGRAVTLDWVTASQEALRSFRALGAHDLYLIDYKLLDHTGLDVVRDLRANGCRSPLIMLTTLSDDSIDQQAMRAGAADYLIKTEMTRPLLQRSIRHALERAEMAKALRQSEERYRSLARNFPNGCILLLDNEARIMLAEGSGLPGFAGTSDADGSGLVGRPLKDAFPAELGERLHQQAVRALSGRSSSAESTHRGRSWLVSMAPQARFDSHPTLVVVVKDITDHRAGSAVLSQQKRLEAIGQIAAGVAHEVNTPVQFVGDNLRFLAEAFAGMSQMLTQLASVPRVSLPEAVRAAIDLADLGFLRAEIPRAIEQSLDGLDRVARVVRGLHALPDPPAVARQPQSLEHLARGAMESATDAFTGIPEVTVEVDPAVPMVVCVAEQIHEALRQILVNAAQAIAATADGRRGRVGIVIVRDADHVEIRVSDNGCGIAEPIRERIFDPFFTTRNVGGGSGQGLFIAHDIVVARHGGTIAVTTRVGVGSTFAISLPLAATPRT